MSASVTGFRGTAARAQRAMAAAILLMGGFSAAAQPAGPAGAGAGCTPTVMVVRHAEDESNPRGGADILSSAGKKHAALYPKLFRDYLAKPHNVGPNGAEVPVCPVGRIIAINPASNPQNNSPGSNPYETIRPLAESLGLPIQVKDAAGVSYSTVYDWNTARRKTLLDNGSPAPTSTVIAWDKQGLNPGADDRNKTINGKKLSDYGYVPLLKALPTNEAAIVGSGPDYTPQRTDFYVFSLPDQVSGKFAYAKTFKQNFSDDGGKTWYGRTALRPTDNPNGIRAEPGG